MKTFIVLCTVAALLTQTACHASGTPFQTRLASGVTQSESGIFYNLPQHNLHVDITYAIEGFRKLGDDDYALTVTAKLKDIKMSTTIVPDLTQRYFININSSGSFLKENLLDLSLSPEGYLGSVQSVRNDKTGDFIVSLVKVAGTILAMAAGPIPENWDEKVKDAKQEQKNLDEYVKKLKDKVAQVKAELMKATPSVPDSKDVKNLMEVMSFLRSEIAAAEARITALEKIEMKSETVTVSLDIPIKPDEIKSCSDKKNPAFWAARITVAKDKHVLEAIRKQVEGVFGKLPTGFLAEGLGFVVVASSAPASKVPAAWLQKDKKGVKYFSPMNGIVYRNPGAATVFMVPVDKVATWVPPTGDDPMNWPKDEAITTYQALKFAQFGELRKIEYDPVLFAKGDIKIELHPDGSVKAVKGGNTGTTGQGLNTMAQTALDSYSALEKARAEKELEPYKSETAKLQAETALLDARLKAEAKRKEYSDAQKAGSVP